MVHINITYQPAATYTSAHIHTTTRKLHIIYEREFLLYLLANEDTFSVHIHVIYVRYFLMRAIANNIFIHFTMDAFYFLLLYRSRRHHIITIVCFLAPENLSWKMRVRVKAK